MSSAITVDDRRLKALIRATSEKVQPRLVADGVNYGFMQEIGVRGRAARPAAGNAAEQIRPVFLKAWKAPRSLEQAQQIVDKTAFDIEAKWKQNIVIMGIVDTGAYVNSVHVVQGDEFSSEFATSRAITAAEALSRGLTIL